MLLLGFFFIVGGKNGFRYRMYRTLVTGVQQLLNNESNRMVFGEKR